MWLQIGIKDIIDILLVAFLIYQTYRLMKGTVAINIFIGVIAFVICWYLVSVVFEMQLLGSILDGVMGVGAFALIVIFQSEIRRFFSFVGTRQKTPLIRWIYKLFRPKESKIENVAVESICAACKVLSKNYFGAIIVITNHNDLYEYAQSGEFVNADINARLIETIFFKNSPLHDGAIIISGNTIIAAACILPVSKNQDLPKYLGLRHRAALGVSEHSDAVAIIVSEETGKISIAKKGKLTLNITLNQLEDFLSLRAFDENEAEIE